MLLELTAEQLMKVMKRRPHVPSPSGTWNTRANAPGASTGSCHEHSPIVDRGGPSIGHGCTHVHPVILVLANEIQVSRRKPIYCRELGDSDPNTDSFVRVWGAPSRTAQGKRRGRSGIPGGCARRQQRAGPPLAQSSPPGKEDLEQGGRSGESFSPREGKGWRRETEGGDEPEAH